MTSLMDAAAAYEPQKTKNIADLQEVAINIEIKDETFTNSDNKEITIQVIEVDGEKYRVPTSVLKQLKIHIKENPNLKKFKVKRSGTGINDTSYTVIPIL